MLWIYPNRAVLAAIIVLTLLRGSPAPAQSPGNLFPPPPRTLTTSSRYVSTTVFHWYTSSGGQLSGPWRPLEGRPAWTGESAFWQDQIKQMMSANIDVMYLHLIPSSEQQRVNLFEALSQMRAQGYDVPKVAPFLDPPITWDGKPPVNLATAAGRDEFVGHYIRFFEQYYSVNTDAEADSYLAQMNGRVQLDTWHVHLNTINTSWMPRAEVVNRLVAAFGADPLVFNNGIHMVTTALSPTLIFSDEKLTQFEVNDYFIPSQTGTYRSAQLKPGYWDQNVRNPGSILPRDGGTHYEAAWSSANNDSALRHINIESWNEYDEGSGIHRGDPGEPYIHPGSGNTSTDAWSDTDDPLEYIKTTAAGARTFNSVPDRDARILWHNLPTRMRPGEEADFQVVVRNDGDMSWTEAQQFRFGQQEFLPGEVVFGPGRFLLDDSQHEIPTYGGIFRGRPVTFDLHLTAPETPGVYLTHWAMLQEHVTWFGQVLTLPIAVAIDGDYNTDGAVNAADYVVWRDTRGQSGTGLPADGNSDGQIDAADHGFWRAHFGDTVDSNLLARQAVPEPSAAVLLIFAIAVIYFQWVWRGLRLGLLIACGRVDNGA
ncbi:MAG: NBR1-Ig-like domain-containing protein [Pirellulales bacterium]